MIASKTIRTTIHLTLFGISMKCIRHDFFVSHNCSLINQKDNTFLRELLCKAPFSKTIPTSFFQTFNGIES